MNTKDELRRIEAEIATKHTDIDLPLAYHFHKPKSKKGAVSAWGSHRLNLISDIVAAHQEHLGSGNQSGTYSERKARFNAAVISIYNRHLHSRQKEYKSVVWSYEGFDHNHQNRSWSALSCLKAGLQLDKDSIKVSGHRWGPRYLNNKQTVLWGTSDQGRSTVKIKALYLNPRAKVVAELNAVREYLLDRKTIPTPAVPK